MPVLGPAFGLGFGRVRVPAGQLRGFAALACAAVQELFARPLPSGHAATHVSMRERVSVSAIVPAAAHAELSERVC